MLGQMETAICRMFLHPSSSHFSDQMLGQIETAICRMFLHPSSSPLVDLRQRSHSLYRFQQWLAWFWEGNRASRGVVRTFLTMSSRAASSADSSGMDSVKILLILVIFALEVPNYFRRGIQPNQQIHTDA